jgi:hypothetical protein
LGTANGIDLTLASSVPDVRLAMAGQPITLSAAVLKNGVAASGAVAMQDLFYPAQSLISQSMVLASGLALDVNGRAAITIPSLGAGSHFISASDNDGSGVVAGVTRIQKIHAYSTTTTVAASPNPVTSGQTVTAAATLTSSGGSVPTGQVTFLEGGNSLGQVPLNSSGSASFAISSLSVGTHSLTASYASDSFCAASSGSTSLAVQGASSGPSMPTGVQASPSPGRKQISLDCQSLLRQYHGLRGLAVNEFWRALCSGQHGDSHILHGFVEGQRAGRVLLYHREECVRQFSAVCDRFGDVQVACRCLVSTGP